jgi:RimJ/RimL family protein N-acetyltransferase
MGDARQAAPIITLRDTVAADLPDLFAHQLDPEALHMAAFPARARDEFIAHWTQVIADASTITSTILVDGAVAGYVTSWIDRDARKIGYWLGRAFWGRGVASRALAQFTRRVPARPLVAHVATRNAPSIRVLEKCGFVAVGRAVVQDGPSGTGIEELTFELP